MNVPPISQNGYPGSPNRENIVTKTVPGTNVKIPVRSGATGDLLMWAAARWHREVEPLITPGCWGWAYRAIRGASQLSNHASGTAIDLNAPKHPLGVPASRNLSAGQIATIRRIVADAKGCLVWGGEWSRPDAMHLEISAGEAKCSAVLKSLTAPTQEDDDMTDADRQMLKEVHAMLTGLWSQVAGEGAKPGKFTGWPSFDGGSGKKLTIVDYLRQADVQLQKVIKKLGA